MSFLTSLTCSGLLTTRKKVIIDIYYIDLKVTYVNIVHLNEQL